MPKTEPLIQLSAIDRLELQDSVRKETHKARVQTLLWSDAGKTDGEIAALLHVRPLIIAQTRPKWVEERSLEDNPRKGGTPKLDAKQEAFLVAVACRDAPDGYETWTMQLLADQLVERRVIDAPISDETVRLRLKKSGQALVKGPMASVASRSPAWKPYGRGMLRHWTRYLRRGGGRYPGSTGPGQALRV